MSPVQYARFRRQVYSLLLALALVAFFSVVLSDAETLALTGLLPPAPALAAVQPERTELTDGTAMDGFGSFSPDGRQLLFMRDGQIWLMPVGGTANRLGTARQLSGNDTAWDAAPTWRPDGKQIAFARHPLAGGGSSIQVIDPATGRIRELLTAQEQIGHLAYAPDSKALYFTTARRLLRTDLGQKPTVREVYTLPDDWDMLPGGLAIMPDGASAIFGAGPRSGRSVQYDLWQLPLKDARANPRQLTQTGGIMPAVDTRGERVAFRNPRSDTGIYLMDLATRQARQVIADSAEAMYFHPFLTADGTGVLLSRLNLGGRPDGERQGKFTSALGLYRLASGETLR